MKTFRIGERWLVEVKEHDNRVEIAREKIQSLQWHAKPGLVAIIRPTMDELKSLIKGDKIKCYCLKCKGKELTIIKNLSKKDPFLIVFNGFDAEIYDNFNDIRFVSFLET